MVSLVVQDVVKSFGAVRAVDGLSFEARPGKIFGLLGANGAGKTTTLRMILGIIDPDQGAMTWQNRPLTRDVRRRIGYLPEERGLDDNMKVEDVLVYLGQLKGLSGRAARSSVRAWLERLGLSAVRQKKVKSLSKGNQQKVQFIAAVLHDPEIIIFDEPFSGFDPVNVELIREEMIRLKAEGKTILLSSHRMDQVETLVDELILLRRGKVVRRGTVRELKAAVPVKRYVLELDVDENQATNGTEGGGKVVWRSDLSKRLDRPGVRWVETEERLVFEVETETLAQKVLASALDLGRIRAFYRVEPTLHEIFVAAMREEEGIGVDRSGA
ncbi:MAG: ABC transporter, ATP-binding protein [Candidatus Carbobacillus altaicus]|uniref:ABC transporter, ATP-binding protein n=1 Tax=Candidatus Carbonibacillus altaicus TaxID=2163959 RepID=A0A2R6XY65_9BACL|nr:MAG: ABC transporter, ATP-binding protein [Candidatus Carbobacillus altaicus]